MSESDMSSLAEQHQAASHRIHLLNIMVTSLILTTLMATTAAPPTYSVNRLAYDGHSLVIDGKPTYVYSGAFHYFRCPKPLWRGRFAAMKKAGLNCAETYVAWNWHELKRPKSTGDFSQMNLTDLKDWLKMAHEEFGLYTIVRPGPYICAEWAAGGYPRWLLKDKPDSVKPESWFRADSPDYLKWCKHWYDAVCKVVMPEQISHRPQGKKGTILFQIENEYDFWGGGGDVPRANQLKALYTYARDGGIDVPITGCWTRELRKKSIPGLKGVFDSPNLYSRHDISGAGWQMTSVKQAQPDAPGMVTELQGGWFSGIGGSLSEDQGGIEAAQIRAITLECMAQGGTILNYYMYFGGTHFGNWGARGLTTTYDYFAPIREWGAVQEKWQETQAIGKMLEKYGSEIAASDKVAVRSFKQDSGEDVTGKLRLTVRKGPGDAQYVFVFNSDEQKGYDASCRIILEDGSTTRVRIGLKPFGYELYRVTKEGAVAIVNTAKPIARPDVPAPIRIAKALTRTDSLVSSEKPNTGNDALLDQFPVDQSLFVYRGEPKLTKQDAAKADALIVEMLNDDKGILSLNGTLLLPSNAGGRRLEFNIKGLVREGANKLTLLYEDMGTANWGGGVERAGVSRAFFSDSVAGLPVVDWKVKTMPQKDALANAQPGIDTSTWLDLTLDETTLNALKLLGQPGATPPKQPAATILMPTGTSALYRTEIELNQAQIDSGLTRLVFDRIDDMGILFVNGKEVASHNEWSVPFEYDLRQAAKVGRNTIAVFVKNTEGEGGLTRKVSLSQTVNQKMDARFAKIGSLAGTQGGWMSPSISTAGWTAVSLDATKPIERKGGEMPKTPVTTFATWYRTEFELPAAKKGTWIPWRMLVRACGNGEMFLNGHSIGRYHEVGPQREFYLPECWLNYGKGKRNVITFCLRSTENGAKLDAVEVSPYPNSAEYR